MKSLKRKITLLYVCSFAASVLPVLVALVIKWPAYVQAPPDAIKLGAGALIGAIIVIMKLVGKLRMPRRITRFAIVFLLSYLLGPVLDDLMLLSGLALLGEFVDFVFFQTAIKKYKEDQLVDKTSSATAEQLEEVLKKYINKE